MRYLELFITFLKIGAFSFGGGYTMIPFFQKEIEVHHWAAASDYTKVIALAQVLPGPFAIDSSAYIGYKVGGIWGAVLASIALSLPSFTALIFITRFYIQFKSNKYIQLALSGVRPVVIGLLISAAYIIGFTSIFKTPSDALSLTSFKYVIPAVGGFLILKYTKMNPIIYIILFAVLGIILY